MLWVGWVSGVSALFYFIGKFYYDNKKKVEAHE
jgi:hypothetical protein